MNSTLECKGRIQQGMHRLRTCIHYFVDLYKFYEGCSYISWMWLFTLKYLVLYQFVYILKKKLNTIYTWKSQIKSVSWLSCILRKIRGGGVDMNTYHRYTKLIFKKNEVRNRKFVEGLTCQLWTWPKMT